MTQQAIKEVRQFIADRVLLPPIFEGIGAVDAYGKDTFEVSNEDRSIVCTGTSQRIHQPKTPTEAEA